MQPFDRYPFNGNQPFGRRRGETARRHYGLHLMKTCGLRHCAYCGLDLTSTFHNWLSLVVDHVVPLRQAVRLGIPMDLYDDLFNCVLSCNTCNTFDNHFVVDSEPQELWTIRQFTELRNTIFGVRKERIAVKYSKEREFYERIDWA